MKSARKIESIFEVCRVVLAVLIAYLISLCALALISADPLYVLKQFTVAVFTTKRRFGDVIAMSTLFTFAGLCMCFMYAVNQFNLAAEGIIIITGCLTTYLALTLAHWPPQALIPALCVAGILCGVLCAAVPALLNAKFDANVVVVSLMFNYILYFLSQYVLKFMMKDINMPSLASFKYPEVFRLGILVRGTAMHSGLFIALACVVVVVVIFRKTPLGYAMRTVGANPQFARYAGIGVTGTIVAAQLLGGAFAGLGGVVEILGRHERFRWLEMPGYGFDGLLVAVIAHRNPAFVPIGAFLLAYIRTSADIVTRTTDIPAEFVSIVQGIIILLIAAEMFLSGTKRKLIYKAAKAELQKETDSRAASAETKM
jgi:simple sugar transport system permease protein